MNKTLGDGALMLVALVAGALLPLQALVNGRLGSALGSPLWASMSQNFVGAAAMGCVILAVREPPPPVGQIAAAPLWGWVGGALGMIYVLSALLATPRLGATRAMTVVIVGQLVASVLLDQFGVLHQARPANLATFAGLALLAAGAFLILSRR
jgi:transporter family-2 protein